MSDTHQPPELAAYFEEARSWDHDRITQCLSSARRAWQVALLGGVYALSSSLALLLLLPLKKIEPFVVRVDNSTGIVDVVPLYSGATAWSDAVTRYFLTHYVQICERFNYSTAESDYEECGAFHAARRNQAWYALWNRNNPASPLNVHKDGSVVSVQVESVSFFRRASGLTDLAQVRYLKTQTVAGGAVAQASHWIATVQYGYAVPSADPAVRRWNPLGFKVINFVSEPEVLHEPSVEPAVSQARALP